MRHIKNIYYTCREIHGDITIDEGSDIAKCLLDGGIVILRCMEIDEHYVLLTGYDSVSHSFYIFNPYWRDKQFTDDKHSDDEIPVWSENGRICNTIVHEHFLKDDELFCGIKSLKEKQAFLFERKQSAPDYMVKMRQKIAAVKWE